MAREQPRGPSCVVTLSRPPVDTEGLRRLPNLAGSFLKLLRDLAVAGKDNSAPGVCKLMDQTLVEPTIATLVANSQRACIPIK